MVTSTSQSASDRIAGEVRARLATEGRSLSRFAIDLGQHPIWALRRFGLNRSVALTIEDLEIVAEALHVSLSDLVDTPLLNAAS